MQIVHGTEIELAVLLAMWLSFSMSEVRGLSKSKSISGNYIVVAEVIVDGEDGPVTKAAGKTYERTRKHRIPPRIQELIDALPEDQDYLVTL